jgi:predicted Zn finger-like uncharacterized protein
MSLITRCPQCANAFKLLPDQVRGSQGWARCGSCSAVFDTGLHLQIDGTQLTPSAAPQAAKLTTATSAQRPAKTVLSMVMLPATGHSSLDLKMGDESTQDGSLLAATHTKSTPDNTAVKPPSAAVRNQAVATPPIGHESRRSRRKKLDRKAASQKKWQNRHLPWAVLAFVFGLALLFQFVVHERDRVATLYPAIKPVTQSLCRMLGCRVEALKELESLQIEHSAFNKLQDDAYQIQLTLRNASDLPLALPMLELTLANARDDAVLRRVFSLAELGVAATIIAPQTELSATAVLALGEYGARISGYRVMAFYP